MRVGTSVEVMVASDQSARPAWAGRVDVQQLQQLGLQRRWGGDGWWVVAVGGVEAQPGQGFEYQPAVACSAWRVAWSNDQDKVGLPVAGSVPTSAHSRAVTLR